MKLAIAGASGRMGRTLIEASLAAADTEVAVALDQAGTASIGRDCGEFLGRTTGVAITSDLTQLGRADTLIDFTRPQGTLEHLQACVAHGTRIVIGTTGFDEAGKRAIAKAAERIAIVFAPNMSVGVNVVFRLLDMAARILDDDYDVEVIEAHHKHKVDAPSGTAIKMGEIVAAARGGSLGELALYARQGDTGERSKGTIGFATVRGGDIVGEHTVLFAGDGERIEITHRSASRRNYAAGSLRAARFLAGRAPGLYDMADVLGLA
jgi:4-hydroxy-tetrahydrodipicolinate reductase